MKVFQIPCFGNCLVNSIAHQIGYKHNLAYDLRDEIVEHLKLHKPQYFSVIINSCYKTYRHEIIVNHNPNELVDRYLHDLKKQQIKCGFECLSAVCNLKQIRIIVYSYEHPQKVVYTPWTRVYNKEINLLYNGCHFYSVVV